MTRTSRQNRQLYALIQKLGIDDETKREMVYEKTQGRTSSSSMLTWVECEELIKSLQEKANQQFDQANNMRRKIIGISHDLGWSSIDPATLKRTADIARIDNWCMKYGQFKKPLNDHSVSELAQLITQFEKIAHG